MRTDSLVFNQTSVQDAWPDVKGIRLKWHCPAFDKETVSHRTQKQLERLKAATIESGLREWRVYPDLCPKRR